MNQNERSPMTGTGAASASNAGCAPIPRRGRGAKNATENFSGALGDRPRMGERIQLRRNAGWRLPEGAVVVTRPSRWGNPFRITGAVVHGKGWEFSMPTPEIARWTSVALYADLVRGIWNPRSAGVVNLRDTSYRALQQELAAWRKRLGGGHPTETARYELGGRDLACWCPLAQPVCHAEVLLTVASGAGVR